MNESPSDFDVTDPGAGSETLLRAWARVPLDPLSSGAWIVAGDLDGDGQAEIVSARNVNRGDVHYTSAVVAQALDGRVLWRWGDPSVGRRGLHHDVACQIHDWDGDGCDEVILCTDGWLVELDGATGAERRRLPLPPEATDCLAFANLSGGPRAAEVLVKTRYSQIWALDRAGQMLWTVSSPGGFPTAHQPVPLDLDGDGRDEVLAGYALLNPDGCVRWTLERPELISDPGHLDCARVLRCGPRPADWRLALSCCSAGRLLVVDGNGTLVWERVGHHFESLDVGRILPAVPEPQMLVDVVPSGSGAGGNELLVYDVDGCLHGRIRSTYCRFHTLVDWDGDGYDEIVVPYTRGLFDHGGRRVGTFEVPDQPDPYGGQRQEEGEIGHIVMAGSFTGSGGRDLAITAPDALYLFRNPAPQDGPDLPLGTAPNFTLY